ncbi:MAG: twin-arginine translocation signal domain-containing protein [Kiritimatiellia bacterium]|nr:twin-arginine translocation signal domain-containing protein [Kiritimatiellia bacterium]
MKKNNVSRRSFIRASATAVAAFSQFVLAKFPGQM